MSNWKELGEVPDSEEEDAGFESQELGSVPLQPPDIKKTNNSQHDVWDVPDSPTEIEPELPTTLPRNGTVSVEPYGTVNLFDSSPLSSLASEQDLPSIDQLVIANHNVHTPNIESSQETLAGAQSIRISSPRAQDDSHQRRPDTSTSLKTSTSNSPRPNDSDNADLEARQVAIRQERSLRPRKPIQEHPYLLENAHYSTFLREHGVKPLRIAAEAERRRRQDTPPDEDFLDESQNSRAADASEDSQAKSLEDQETRTQTQETGDDDAPRSHLQVDLSSSPLKTSPLNDGTGFSTRASSQTDNTSFLDHDLPDIDELLTLPPRPEGKPSRQRQASPLDSSARKKRRYTEKGTHNSKSEVGVGTKSNFSDPLVTPPRLVARRPSSSPVQIADRSSRSLLQSPDVPIPEVHALESDSEGSRAAEQDEDVMVNGEDDTHESNSEMETTLARRLRRVLPASWLRLDQQSGREKVQRDVNRRHREKPAEVEHRRGVAQKRLLTGSLSKHIPLFDDSEDDDESPPLNPDPEDVQVQAELVLQPLNNLNIPLSIESDDESSILEDDHIDFMPSNRKRQLKLSESFQSSRKRVKAVPRPIKADHNHLHKQPKITGMLQGRTLSQHVARPRVAQRPKHKQENNTTRMRGSRTTRATTSPRLSILDVIDSKAPQFLRIAARTVKTRQDQGRSSPHRKWIKLANRRDHVDAAISLHEWKIGSIKQRPAVTASLGKPVQAASHPRKSASRNNDTSETMRRLLDPKGMPRNPTRQTAATNATDNPQGKGLQPASYQRALKHSLRRIPTGLMRLAQLETDQDGKNTKYAFHSIKRHLDRQYQHNQGPPSLASTRAPSVSGEAHVTTSVAAQDGEHQVDHNSVHEKPTKRRIRKSKRPRLVDVQAPEFTQAHDPLPTYRVANTEQPIVDDVQHRLLGLGPYGTYYTHHFETFPLDPGVYFHDSTLIGKGLIEAVETNDPRPRIGVSRPRVSFSFGGKTLRWDTWTEQVSSELGIALDHVSEHLGKTGIMPDDHETQAIIEIVTSILNYVTDAISFANETQVRLFIIRLHEVLQNLNRRITLCIPELGELEEKLHDCLLKINDRLLLTMLMALKICESSASVADEQFQLQELLKSIARTQVSVLVRLNTQHIRRAYDRLNSISTRERGIRDNEAAIHSWVVLLKVLELARIPRASFWDILQVILATPQALGTTNAGELERMWEMLFLLLPLMEFNDAGVVVRGRRHHIGTDSWGLPQKLLKRVFQLYEQNPRQAPSFNNYCRALVARCHYLVDQWGWRRPLAVIGLIFDFFGSQGLGHLRNEEVYASPRFLESLHHQAYLGIEPEDRCFHVFLKLLALSIQKLRDFGATKDIRNLVTRTLPNHNRQYEKEQNIHERDLAALRNHHDLLCTLFWAAPPDLRPLPGLIKGLVDPLASHKEATLINLRAWRQLTRFIVGAGESKASFPPFAEWRDTFFQQILHLFDSVESDIQRQYLSLPKDVVQSINDSMIQAMVSTNKQAVLDVLHYSVSASLEVMRLTPDLTNAISVLNTSQLQQIFKHFAVEPAQLDWGILRQSVAVLDIFLSKISDFMDAESQQSENLFMQHTEADDGLALLDNDIAKSFFSMARNMLSSRANKSTGSLLKMDREDCVEKVIVLSARLSANLIRSGFLRPSQLFKFGTHGLFDDIPQKLDWTQRRYLVLFVSAMLKHGFDDFSDAGFSLLEVWALAIVNPRTILRHEYQLAEQLRVRNKEYVPDVIIGLVTQPDYRNNRDLFEYMISTMRTAVATAGPSLKRILVAEHSKVLKLVMEQLKGDLKLVAQQQSGHHEYVLFVREIVGHIRALGSEICTVDDYFYHISKEYSPPAQDPQMQVPAMVAYGLRIAEGETRAAHQLFFFLLNNFKASMLGNSLGEQSHMLYTAMKDRRLLRFVLGHMFPAIIRSCLTETRAYALLDVYVEALRQLLVKNAIPQELVEDDLPQLEVTLAVTVGLFGKLRRKREHLSNESLHVINQVFAAINLTWPSVFALHVSGSSTDKLVPIKRCLEHLNEYAVEAHKQLEHLISQGMQGIGAGVLFEGVDIPGLDSLHASSLVVEFTEYIIQDIQATWTMNGNRVSVQAPGRARAAPSTQPNEGVRVLEMQTHSLLVGLLERVLEYHKDKLQICHCAAVPFASPHQSIHSGQAMGSLFQLPEEILLTPLLQSFPGREHQIRSLATLLHPNAITCRNVVVHGAEATGKSSIVEGLLARLSEHIAADGSAGGFQHAVVNSTQCITGRHLFERVLGAVVDALQWPEAPRRCESVAQLTVELTRMLKYPDRDPRWRFVLALDAVDRQRDAPQMLLPALARLSEIIPSLTCVFIVTAPPAGFLRTPLSPHLHFPPYTKSDFVRILALTPPPPMAGTTQQETSDLWTRFCAAVHDSLIKSAARTLPSFRQSCHALWPRFTAPVVAGINTPKEFSKLLIAGRAHFQDESLLNPSIVTVRSGSTAVNEPVPIKPSASMAELTALLPTVARLLLLAAYLASHNAARHDLTLFSTHHHGRKRRRGGGFASSRGTPRSKHRKIARKLLGAHAFVLERMMAIFEAVRREWVEKGAVGVAGLDGDVGMAIATLASLRLLVKAGGGGDTMDRGGKWRINVGWEVVRGIGRSIGVEVEEWLIE
ncbi:Protein mms22 [Paramyrothecium foliicola]|nr:Protein mms22 [Paramyrothecium foliicola]